MTRTYSPLPAWPVTAMATALWLSPRSRLRLPLGVLVSGYVVGPLLARLLAPALLTVDDAIVELDGPDHDCDTGNFDRSLCPEPCGAMHSYCDTCGVRQDPCPHDPQGETP